MELFDLSWFGVWYLFCYILPTKRWRKEALWFLASWALGIDKKILKESWRDLVEVFDEFMTRELHRISGSDHFEPPGTLPSATTALSVSEIVAVKCSLTVMIDDAKKAVLANPHRIIKVVQPIYDRIAELPPHMRDYWFNECPSIV